MSAQKRGLGRGLDALLGTERLQDAERRPDAERRVDAERAAASGLTEIRIDAIRPNSQQPRKNFDSVALAELQQSIAQLGVLVPVIVRPVATDSGAVLYELIAGERRWRAASAAHIETIPAIVRDADDRTSLELAVVENLQRQDLDALEEAMGFAHLIEEYRFTQERLAERLGKSRPAISNALRLLGLSDAIKARLRAGALTVGHARALLALPEGQRDAVAARIEAKQLTVRDVERLAHPRKAASAPATRIKSADLLDVEKRLRYALGAPVSIVPVPGGGRIEVRYVGDGDLARIVDVLLGDTA